MVRTSTIVEEAPERVVTNRVPVIKFPRTISFYEYDGDNTKIASAMSDTGIPHAMCGRLIISFAGMSAIQQHLPPAFTLRPRTHASFDEFINGLENGTFAPGRDEAPKIAIALLRQQVERYLQLRGLKKFESSGASSFYFPKGLVPNDKVPYQAASGRKTNKNVVGRSERNQVYWHLAMKVNIVMGPPAVVRFKPYLCFSEDGKSAITDVKASTTYVLDLVRRVEEILMHKRYGTYHIVNGGACSYFEFAKEAARILDLSDVETGNLIEPVSEDAMNRRATRPRYSPMRCILSEELGLPALRDWRVALRDYVSEQL